MSPLDFLSVLVVLGAISTPDHALSLETFHNPMPSGMLMPVRLGSNRDRRQAVNLDMNQPLRILPIYAPNFDSILQEKSSLVKVEIIPKLLEFLRQSLSVASLPGPILLNSQCSSPAILRNSDGDIICGAQCAPTFCGAFEVPQEHLKQCTECNTRSTSVNLAECVVGSPSQDGEGVSGADFVLYITANQALCPDSQDNAQTVAFAAACQNEVVQDRPVAGTINFCPDGTRNRDPDFAFAVSKHEILHALGFSRFLFALWRDPETNQPRTTRDDRSGLPFIMSDGMFMISQSTVESAVTYSDWFTTSGLISHSVMRLVTPAVLKEARMHFGCESLAGVELENQGGLGTRLSHWEKRVLGNEAMTGQLTFNPVFSRLTFAALEDSGWYRVNYSLADELVWGRGAGCRFAEGSCGEWINTQSSNNQPLSPFCDTFESSSQIRLGCTADHEAVSRCNLVADATNEIDYQYFNDSARAGGRVVIADYCPFQDVIQFISRDGSLRGTTCSVSSNIPPSNLLLEAYGFGARCVTHGRQWTVNGQPVPNYGAGCYQYSCREDQVAVTIRDQTFMCNCSRAGQEMEVNVMVNSIRYQGSIICPPCPQICHLSSQSILQGAVGTILPSEDPPSLPTADPPSSVTPTLPPADSTTLPPADPTTLPPADPPSSVPPSSVPPSLPTVDPPSIFSGLPTQRGSPSIEETRPRSSSVQQSTIQFGSLLLTALLTTVIF